LKHAVNVDGCHVINGVDDINTRWYDGVGMYRCLEFCSERTFFAHTYGDSSTRGNVEVRRVNADTECGGGVLSVCPPD
jgi:hypothetical protein